MVLRRDRDTRDDTEITLLIRAAAYIWKAQATRGGVPDAAVLLRELCEAQLAILQARCRHTAPTRCALHRGLRVEWCTECRKVLSRYGIPI